MVGDRSAAAYESPDTTYQTAMTATATIAMTTQ
jgi:hypothetical protein